ncbi:MAG: hypothetical protein AAF962_03835 [Actinomycetota bacterium]
MTPDELMQQACPKIGVLGAAFYFDAVTVAKGDELGLGGFRFYFMGRGGVLGDVEPAVVRSAFGYFAPPLVEKLWNKGREIVDPREAGRVYVDCSRDFGRAHFGDIDGLDAFCQAAETINAATDEASLPLYAGLNAEPLSDDLPARAMQLTALLREYRGSAHLAAIRCMGLDDAVAHAIKRPDDVQMFGYEATPEFGDAERALHDEAEAMTDRMVRGAYAAVDADGAKALVAGLDAMEAALS